MMVNYGKVPLKYVVTHVLKCSITQKAQFNKVTHCIFDLDGLLINTQQIYDEVLNELIHQYGGTFTEELRNKLMGSTMRDSTKIFRENLNLSITAEDLMDKYKKKARLRVQNPEFLPGAVELVRHLHDHKIPIAVATSSSEEGMMLKTKKHRNIFKLFHHIVCGTSDPDVKNGKPQPDIFLVAAERFPDKPEPCKCLVFEDAPNGIVGAVKAGMQCVMVPAGRVSEEIQKIATLIIKSLNEFKPELFELPHFKI